MLNGTDFRDKLLEWSLWTLKRLEVRGMTDLERLEIAFKEAEKLKKLVKVEIEILAERIREGKSINKGRG